MKTTTKLADVAREILDDFDLAPFNMSDSCIQDAERALTTNDDGSELAEALKQAVRDYEDNVDGDADDEGCVYTTSYVNESTIERIRNALS